MAIVDSTGAALRELCRKTGRQLSVNDVRVRHVAGNGRYELVCVDGRGRVLPNSPRAVYCPLITDCTQVAAL